MKKIPEKILFVLYFTLSIVMGYLAVKLILESELFSGICLLAVALMLNPLILRYLFKKFGDENAYVEVVMIISICVGFLFAWFVSIVLMKVMGINVGTEGEEEYKIILKICVYLVYLVLLFILKAKSRVQQYILFGVIYLISAVFFYIFENEQLVSRVADWIDKLPFGNMSKEELDILINLFLFPVKEAVLTFIIFDTVGKNESRKEKKQKEVRKQKKQKSWRITNIFTKRFQYMSRVKKVFKVEKNRLCLSFLKCFAVTYFTLYLVDFCKHKINIIWILVECLVLVVLFVCIDYHNEKKREGNIWNAVVDDYFKKNEICRYNHIKESVISFKSASDERFEDKKRIVENINLLEAILAKKKADIIITPIVFSVFAWFIGKDTISFTEIQMQLINLSIDAFMKIFLLVIALMAVRIIIKQYPEYLFIEKTIEGIKKELRIEECLGEDK